MAVEKKLLEGINLIAQGKEEGFNILYSHTYNYVYGRAKFIMKNEEDALDLTQETFIQAYRGIGSLEDANNVYAWLGGIVYRQGMKIYRKKRDVLVNEEAEGIFEEVISEDKDFSPEDASQEKATSEIVMSMIEELPEQQKAAVLAFYYDNMKIDDIARMFECSANTIKSRLSYAKKFLRNKVEEHEKKNRYKLCSLTPAIILLALRSLFTTDAYAMPKETAQLVFNASCGAVGVTPSAIMFSGSAVMQTASTGAQTASAATTAAQAGAATAGAQAGAVATTVATKVGLTLGAKIGIGIVALAVAGGVSTGVILHNKNTENTTPTVQEEVLEESSEMTDTPEVEPEIIVSEENPADSTMPEEVIDGGYVASTYGWEEYIGPYLYRDGVTYPDDGGCLVRIVDVEATSENETDVTFDIEIENVNAYTQVTEALSVENVGMSDGRITFEATSSANNQWYVSLDFMADKSIVMIADVSDPELGTYTLRAEGDPVILTRMASYDYFTTTSKLQEGRYQFAPAGGDAYENGGYVLTISELSDAGDTQYFTMQLDIKSEEGPHIDTLVPDMIIALKGSVATFMGDTAWGNRLYGYFYVVPDGSVHLVFDNYGVNPDMIWIDTYPQYTEEPIVLYMR